jgi:hypothetical protein
VQRADRKASDFEDLAQPLLSGANAEFRSLSAGTHMNGTASDDLWVPVSGHVNTLCTIKLPDILAAGHKVAWLIRSFE